MNAQPTGGFQAIAVSGKPCFPADLRRRPFSGLDRRFLAIFGACALLFFVTIGILSRREVPEVLTEKEIAKIQERYARLVLNQPTVQPQVERKVEQATGAQAAVEKKDEAKVDRSTETVAERTERRESTRAQREARRTEISKAVQSSGIFAAITSAGKSGGSGAAVTDLLGAAEGVGDIGTVSVSKGTFASRSVDAAELTARKGERTAGVGIARESVGRVESARLASTGAVNLTAAAVEMRSESGAQVSSRSCIQQVFNTEARRIKRVYETWLKRDPALSGQIQVKCTILPSGAVINPSVSRSTTGNQEFDQAILRYVGRWSFADCGVAESIEVEFPFAFEAQS